MFINRPDYRYHRLFRCAQIPSATRPVPLLTESQTALETHLTILPNIAKPNTSTYAITLCDTTFTTAKSRLHSLETTQLPRNIRTLQNFLHYAIFMYIFMYYKRRFFSEYAALQRVSHHQSLVSIKDFSYLIRVHNVFSLLFSFFKKPWECYTGKAF